MRWHDCTHSLVGGDINPRKPHWRVCWLFSSLCLFPESGKVHLCTDKQSRQTNLQRAPNEGIRSWLNWGPIEAMFYFKIPWNLSAIRHLQTFPPVANIGNDNNYLGVRLFQMDRSLVCTSGAYYQPTLSSPLPAVVRQGGSGAAWLRRCCG